MDRRVFIVCVLALTILPLALFGCKGKVDRGVEETAMETSDTMYQGEPVIATQTGVMEPAQTVATETIPPTAQPQIAEKTSPAVRETARRDKDIQAALRNAGFYAGSIDGKIGPKTKKAIEEFQKAKGLKVDGKVGPKTWAELEKYLAQ